MKSRRIDTRESRTAAYTCVSRAGAYLEKDIRFRGPDHLAELFLPMYAKLILRSSPLRKLFFQQIAPPGIYEYVLARTKVLDQVFIQALESGFVQIVLSGAGFDTRALRFADQNRRTKVYELDVATTQQPKIEILAHYTPSDLEEVFLTAENGDRFGRINGTHCIAIAAVESDTRGD